MAPAILPILWVTLGGLFVIGCLLFTHLLPSLMHSKLPLGSFGWPLLGETLRFLQPHSSDARGSFLQDHCSRYGKVFKSHLFLSPTIVSCDHELNNFILQNEDRFFQGSYPKPVHGVLGKNSLLVVVGETHKRLRTMALALVNATKAKPGYLNDIETMATYVMTRWKGKEEVYFYDEAKKFTFSVIVKQVLGLSPDDATTAIILRDFRTFMNGLISFPLYIPGLPYAKAIQARTRISSSVKNILEERARSRGNSTPCNGGQDFLDVLLSVGNLSDEEKVSFVMDSLLGGYETTSLLLAMAVHFLGQCPAALDQLLSEHRHIRADRDENQPLSWDDYKKMEFTQNVINESLRCGNIVKFVHRKALKDCRFKDYVIPSGWKVLPVLSAVHLDPSLHEDPLTFNPWRWEGQNQTASKKFTPFGGGTRLCPGSELAKVETAVFLHHFLLNFRWKPAAKDGPIAYPYVEFPRGLPLKVEPIHGE